MEIQIIRVSKPFFFAKFAIFLLLMVENHAIEYFFNARVKGKGKRKIIGF